MPIPEVNIFRTELNKALDDTMQTVMSDAVKTELSIFAEDLVYNAYEPRFYSRRRDYGGIMDEATMQDDYDSNTKTLTVSAKADWQQLWGGMKPKSDLADAIESGEKRFYQHRAGPRPFHKPAEDYIAKSGFADRYLESEIDARLTGLSL